MGHKGSSRNLELDTSYTDDIHHMKFKIPKKDKTGEVDMKSILRQGVTKATPSPRGPVSSYSKPKPQRYRDLEREKKEKQREKKKVAFNPDTFAMPEETSVLGSIVSTMSKKEVKKPESTFADVNA